MKKIAILGAGLSGLAIGAHLSIKKQLHELDLDIVLFDPAPLGDNASGLSAGLLHSFPGAHAKRPPHAYEGLEATLELVGIAERALGDQVLEKTGLLRVAITPEQKQDYLYCANQNPGIEWLEKDQCQKLIPSLCSQPGIFIESAWIIQTKKYLKGLWKYCESNGVIWEARRIKSLQELSNYDTIIVAAGAAAKSIQELAHLSIKPVKGQLLVIEWPSSLPPLAMPLNSQAYIVMSPDKKMCFAGATYERNYDSDQPDLDAAKALLFPKIVDLIPALEKANILECKAGMRAATPTNQPLVERVTDNCWVLGGMGSKGLLYHALFAKKLANMIHN